MSKNPSQDFLMEPDPDPRIQLSTLELVPCPNHSDDTGNNFDFKGLQQHFHLWFWPLGYRRCFWRKFNLKATYEGAHVPSGIIFFPNKFPTFLINYNPSIGKGIQTNVLRMDPQHVDL